MESDSYILSSPSNFLRQAHIAPVLCAPPPQYRPSIARSSNPQSSIHTEPARPHLRHHPQQSPSPPLLNPEPPQPTAAPRIRTPGVYDPSSMRRPNKRSLLSHTTPLPWSLVQDKDTSSTYPGLEGTRDSGAAWRAGFITDGHLAACLSFCVLPTAQTVRRSTADPEDLCGVAWCRSRIPILANPGFGG